MCRGSGDLDAAEQGEADQWGGTGPDAFDCSGLAMMAYRFAGLAIPRTSQEQWAAGPAFRPGRSSLVILSSPRPWTGRRRREGTWAP